MTDVRDREPQIEVADADVAPRTSLVARALAPIRRITSRDVSHGRSRDIVVRPQPTLDDVPITKTYAWPIRCSFVLFVLVPIICSGLYFFRWASDQYVAEARFAVRQVSPETGHQVSGQKDVSPSAPLLGGLPNMKTQDAEIIASYIKSRAIIDDVSKTLDVRAIFQRPGADRLARLSANASTEDLTAYWGHMISVYVEASSGIVTVSASAFRRDDALALVRAILASSDRLANSLSVKMLADQTRLAEDEVRRSEGEVRTALTNLQTFRNSAHLIDPVESSKSAIKLIYELIAARIQAESDVYVAERSQGPNAPGMATLRAKVESIKGQIKDLQGQLVGDQEQAKNMAAVLSSFEGLELKKQFAEQMFTFAENTLERARLAAIRQSIYLEVFVQPSLPEEAAFPLRWTDFALVAFAALMIWITGLTISASILDHRV